MAFKFNEVHGSAIKNNVDYYDFKNGENRVRLVGDILPRYNYWIRGTNNKNIPFECLAFDRATETFNNKEKDWVKEYFPDLKCQWGYAVQGINLETGKLEVVNLKKKLWEAIVSTAKDLGDPTDPETGWDVVFDRNKTGKQIYNVEYVLRPLACKVRPLTDAERELISEMKSMDEVLPRPTPDAQKALLDRIMNGDNAEENVDEDSIENEFDVD